MTEIKIENRKPNVDKLLSYGFVNLNGEYIFRGKLVDGQMKLTVKVCADQKLYAEIIDGNSDDEYVLHLVSGAVGTFVGQVKAEYAAIIEDISAICFDPEVFKSEQAKAVIAYVKNTYGDDLEYLWKKFPNNAIVRRKDNKKWYAVILTVCRRKIGLDSDEFIEILDLRLKPEDTQRTVDNVRYFPGYHMNKKHWITICLDGTLPNEEIFARIDGSYDLA